MFSSLPYGYLSFYTIVRGTIFSISSLHWFGVWAGLEINLIGFLPMLVYQKGVAVRESAVKYFVVQALGSVFFIVGRLVSLISVFFTLGQGVVILSLVIKIGGFPFHFWLPSVMSGLNWFPCLILATWQKIAPLFIILLFLRSVPYSNYILILCIVAVMSGIVGGIGGVNQTQIRSLLAYSSISHIGWIVFRLMHRYEAIKFYFGIYVLINLCIFLSLWEINRSRFQNINIVFEDKYYGGLILFILISLAGLPPLLGFVPKWGVVVCRIERGMWGFVFILILGSLLGIFYYLRLFMYGILSVGLKDLRKHLRVTLVGRGCVNLLGGIILLMRHFIL